MADSKSQETADIAPAQNVLASTKATLSPEQKNAVIARHFLKPPSRASMTLQELDGFEVDSYALGQELDKVANLKDGDYSHAAEMLISQSYVLDGLFNRMIVAALANGYDSKIDPRFLDLSLRAQKQARQTIETLKALREKTSPALIQQNAYMQINTGATIPSSNNSENELLNEMYKDE